MLAAVPLLILPVAAYNLLALLGDGFSAADGGRLDGPMLYVSMASGGRWGVSLGDVLVFGALCVLFVELLKSTSSRRHAIVNHGLSMLLFVVCLVEFLLLPAFATSTFFLISTMVLLDVLAGFTVSIMAARKDVDWSGA